MPSNITCCCKNVQIVFFSVVKYFFLQSLGIYLSGGNIFFRLTLCLRTRVSKVAVSFPAGIKYSNQIAFSSAFLLSDDWLCYLLNY